jgi:hypothetical protein
MRGVAHPRALCRAACVHRGVSPVPVQMWQGRAAPGADVSQVPVQMWPRSQCRCGTGELWRAAAGHAQYEVATVEGDRGALHCTAGTWLHACARSLRGRVVLNIVRRASHARVNAPSRPLVQGRRLTTCTRLSCGMLHGADCMPLHIVPTVLPTPPGPSCGCFRMP